MKHTLYLCGPMTGLPEWNYPAFEAAAKRLNEAGYGVFNPVHNGLPASAPWAEHLRRDIGALVTCTGVATLPGTDNSRGAQLELRVATDLEMPVASVEVWLDAARCLDFHSISHGAKA